MSQRKTVVYWFGIDEETRPTVRFEDGSKILVEALIENLIRTLINKNIIKFEDLK